MKILIMAGGTGGHIFPALAVAKRLREQGHIVHWLGAPHSMEADITQANAIPMHFISIGGLRGKNWRTKLFAPLRLSRALLQSLSVMLRFKPDVVLGMGGYVTGPAGLAAWLTRKKLIIHEQNAIAGMTNQILAKFSTKVLQGFPNSFPTKITALETGNPVREDFYQLLPPEKRMPKSAGSALKILVIGGSAGSRALNNIIPQLLKIWPQEPKPMFWHQAGSKNIKDAQLAYFDQGYNVSINAVSNIDTTTVKLVDFIQDTPTAYAWADVVICRAGALTVAEIAAAGIPSIFIPYPYAVDDHQTKNAQHLVQAGAAFLIQEKDLTVEKLSDILQRLNTYPEQLVVMARAAYNLAKPDALDLVVKSCIEG